MQEDCDEIYPAVLVNIVRDQEAYDIMNNQNSPFLARFYGPAQQDQNGKTWCPSLDSRTIFCFSKM